MKNEKLNTLIINHLLISFKYLALDSNSLFFIINRNYKELG